MLRYWAKYFGTIISEADVLNKLCVWLSTWLACVFVIVIPCFIFSLSFFFAKYLDANMHVHRSSFVLDAWQRCDWAHEPGHLPGRRRHRCRVRRPSVYPPDQADSGRSSGSRHPDPADGAAADHERWDATVQALGPRKLNRIRAVDRLMDCSFLSLFIKNDYCATYYWFLYRNSVEFLTLIGQKVLI